MILNFLLAALLITLLITLYFAPVAIAVYRKHVNSLPIFIITIFLGWTGVFWVLMLAWSLIFNPQKKEKAESGAEGWKILIGIFALLIIATLLVALIGRTSSNGLIRTTSNTLSNAPTQDSAGVPVSADEFLKGR